MIETNVTVSQSTPVNYSVVTIKLETRVCRLLLSAVFVFEY